MTPRKATSLLIGLLFLLFVSASAASNACAQQKASTSAKQLIGVWKLISLKTEANGKTWEPYGPNPRGLFFFDRSGYYAVLQFSPDIPKFAANSRDKGTPEENRAVVLGSNAHFGKYAVNEKEGFFTVRAEAGTYPNWVGVDQKRIFSITGDELKITNPITSTGGKSTLVLKRVK